MATRPVVPPAYPRYAVFIPFILGVVLYLNTLGHEYTLDDNAVISNHEHVQAGLSGIPKILTTNFLNGLSGMNDGLYRPVPLISFAVEKTLFNSSPFFSHLINVLLYALTGSLVFLFFRNMFFKDSPFIALLLALLFIAHPVHTEVVAGVKGRDDVLALLFLLVTGILLFKGLAESKFPFTAVAGFTFLLALCSKESSVAAVVAMPLLLWSSNKLDMKKIGIAFGLLVVIAIPWYFWRTHVINSMPMPVDQGIFSNLNNSLADATNFSQRLSSAAYLQLLYIWKLVFPAMLSHDYSFNAIPLIDLANWKGIVGLIVVVALIGFALYQLRKKDLMGSGILWFFLFIAPVANLFMLIGATFAERFLYTPSLGFSLLSALLLVKLLKDKKNFFSFKANPAFMGVFVVVMCLYSLQTIARNRDWRNNEALFGADVVKVSNSARANYNYGTALFERAKRNGNPAQEAAMIKEALPYMLKADEIYPNYIEALNNIGSAYFELKDYDKALETFYRIKKVKPEYTKTYYNLAVSYEKMGKLSESADNYIEFTNRKPDIDLLFHAAVLYGSAGRMDEAIPVLNSVVKANPQYAPAYLNLGQAYGMKGDFINSEEALKKFLQLKPNDVEGLQALATTYLRTGKNAEARALLQQVVARDPNNAWARNMLNGI